MDIDKRNLIFCRLINTKDKEEFEKCYALLTSHKSFGVWTLVQKYRPIELKECNQVKINYKVRSIR